MSESKTLTKNWNLIDPLSIDSYLDAGGYAALRRFVKELDPEAALKAVKASGLTGRGGACFPTGSKWELVMAQKRGEKFFVCNLDESEPGVYKDRSLAENDPHLLIEGIIISALTVGAKKAYLYLNGSFRSAREKLERAIEQARERQFLGQRILKSKYSLELEIFSGAGAYVCGEETALLNSIEGKRGEPRLRPPYPTEAGLFGRPTVVNNAETIANIPRIILEGGEAYGRSATKLYILGGAVERRSVAEGPLDLTIREAIESLGGGIRKGKELWFVQVGGAAGHLYLPDELDTPISGTGAVLAVDKTADIHELLLSWTGFFRRESCGKCIPCREGTFRLHEIAGRLKDGVISDRDKEALKDILWTLENTTFCPLGKFAATAMRDAVEKLGILA